MYPVEALLPPRGREACTTDDRGSETAEVKGSWLGGRLVGRSRAEGDRAVPKIVTGISEAADVGNLEALTEVKGSWSGGRIGGRSGAEDGRAMPKLVTGIPEAVAAGNPEVPTILSGGCLGGHLRAAAGAVIIQSN